MTTVTPTALITPRIVLMDETSGKIAGLDTLGPALQKFVDQYFGPVWGKSCSLAIAAADYVAKPADWQILFIDNADVAGALGYHDVTPSGTPLGKVFVETTLKAGEKLGVTASHELAELLVDPGCQQWAIAADNRTFYAYETADAVEETSFQIDGIDVTNFVYPAWFDGYLRSGSQQFDLLGLVKRPYQLLPGGYASIVQNGRMRQIFGSKAKAERFNPAAKARRANRGGHLVTT